MKHSKGFLRLVRSARKRVRETTVNQVKSRLRRGDDFLLIDVREESEWQARHIVGAIYLGRGILERDIETLIPGKQKEIVLYCGGGYRSVLAAESLQKMGYRNVYSMKGGWRAWKKSRGKTES